MTRFARAILVGVAGVSASACILVLDLKDKVYVDAEGGGAPRPGDETTTPGPGPGPGGSDANPDREPITACPTGTKGAPLVFLEGRGCIDATEVTQEQYAAFLADKGGGIDVGGQPTQCSWNTSFVPGPACAYDAATNDCGGASCKQFPQGCVDWCDAYAYCAWAGKHLCGHPLGGPASLASITDSKTSLWTAACTSDGKHRFPYGDSWVEFLCFDSAFPDPGAHQVGGLENCQSKEAGFRGIFDLSGNLAEWEDACVASAGSNDKCRVRGGSYTGSQDFVACDRQVNVAREYHAKDVGFRCCFP